MQLKTGTVEKQLNSGSRARIDLWDIRYKNAEIFLWVKNTQNCLTITGGYCVSLQDEYFFMSNQA